MTARILPPTGENIRAAAAELARGQLVAMPTETVYGLAGVALNDVALARIFETKERPTFDPLILHLPERAGSLSALGEEGLGLVDTACLSPKARERASLLISRFWPGPLTLVLPKTRLVPDLATSGLPTVALRMPRHPVAQALLEAAQVPLAAPSANRFGRISPTTAQAVLAEVGDRIGIILDGGPCGIGVESTVVQIERDGATRLLRPGGAPPEEIESCLGVALEKGVTAGLAASPGRLKSHYAPDKPLFLLPAAVAELGDPARAGEPGWRDLRRRLDLLPAGRVGLLHFSGDARAAVAALSRWCGRGVQAQTLGNDMAVAARGFFSALRALDGSAETVALLAEPCPIGHGLGHAISDRLARAAASTPKPPPREA